MSRPAVFLDRDNTLIDDPGFIDDPDQVRLLPGAAQAVRRLRSAGYAVVVASNQSGIARGLITEEQLEAVHQRLRDLLREEGAELDAIYYCPFLDGPEAVVETYRRASEHRKPGCGMLIQAARDLNLELGRSWMIGDRVSDIEAGQRAGCRTILVALSHAPDDNGACSPDYRADSLREAANIVEKESTPPADQPTTSRRGTTPDADADVRALLTEIRDLLDRQQRARRQEDFSFLRLFGTLTQMLAVVTAIWGFMGMFDTQTMTPAIARLALAGFFQLVTLTTIAIESRH